IDRREASAAPMVQSLSSPSPVGASFPRTQHADGGTSILAVCRALLLQDLSRNVGPFWADAPRSEGSYLASGFGVELRNPARADGVYDAAGDIAAEMDGFTVIVIKSTVPVENNDEVDAIVRKLRPDAVKAGVFARGRGNRGFQASPIASWLAPT